MNLSARLDNENVTIVEITANGSDTYITYIDGSNNLKTKKTNVNFNNGTITNFTNSLEIGTNTSVVSTSAGVTYENLSANGDIGLGASQVPEGDKVLALTGGTLSGNLDLDGNELRQPGYQTQTVSSSSGSLTIDWSGGNWAYTTLTENITSITINNWPSSGTAAELVIEVTQDSTPRTVDWSGVATSVDYHTSDGNAPDISTADETYLIHISSRDALSNAHLMSSKQ